jgi:hypothetical protein
MGSRSKRGKWRGPNRQYRYDGHHHRHLVGLRETVPWLQQAPQRLTLGKRCGKARKYRRLKRRK